VSSDFLKNPRATLRQSSDFLVGELLVKTGMISARQLDEARRLAGSKHVSLGQMLVVARAVSNKDLTVIVDAQTAVRDRMVDINSAVEVVKIACRSGISFNEALQGRLTLTNEGEVPTTKLGELLVEAKVITREQLEKAMQRSLAIGLPLGRILVLNGAINELLLTTVLEIQVRLRDQNIERSEAIAYIKTIPNTQKEEEISVEQAFEIQAALKAPRRKPVRLGELLVMAGILNESDVINALEMALSNEMQIGEVIVNQGFITSEFLETALKLQSMIDQGLIDGVEAADALREIQLNGGSLEKLCDYFETTRGPNSEISFEHLLASSGVIAAEDIEKAFGVARQDPEIVAGILNATGYVSEAAAGAVLRCYGLVANGYLTYEDGLVALDYCFKKQATVEISFDQALADLGWSGEPGLQAVEPNLKTESSEEEVLTESAVESFIVELAKRSGDDLPALTQEQSLSLQEQTDTFARMPVLIQPPGQLREVADVGAEMSTAQENSPLPRSEKPVSKKSRPTTKGLTLKHLFEAQAEAGEPIKEETATANKAPSNGKNLKAESAHFVITEQDKLLLAEAASLGATPEQVKAAALLLAAQDREALSVGPEQRQERHKNNSGQASEEFGSPPDTDQLQQSPAVPPSITTSNRPLTDRERRLVEVSSTTIDEVNHVMSTAYVQLAEAHYQRGNYAMAEKLYIHILDLKEAEHGKRSSALLRALNNLAGVLCIQGKFGEAEIHMERAISILEELEPDKVLKLAEALGNLAGVYYQQEKFTQCGSALERCLRLKERALGGEHPELAETLKDYAKLLRRTGRAEEAELVSAQARVIIEKPPA
jgi:tetratricopeptide (TPR) repeat protein